jgi:exopolysaccharide production protein ExoZ
MIYSLQALRGIAALLVLLFHFSISSGTLTFFGFGNAGVEIFFVLSGFIIVYTSRSLSLKTYAYKRFIRIFPIYWVVLAGLFIPAMFFHSTYEFSFPNIASTFLLLPNHQMLNGVSWTLSFELYFYAMAGLVIWKPGLKWLCPVLCVTALVNLFFPFDGFIFSPFILLFFMGVGVFYLPRISKPWSITGCLLAAVLFVTWGQTLHQSFLSPIVYGLLSTVFIWSVINWERHGLKVPGFMVLLGEASYVLYLIHLPILNFLLKRGAGFWVLGLIIALSIVVHLFIEKPLTKWLAGLISRPISKIATTSQLPANLF